MQRGLGRTLADRIPQAVCRVHPNGLDSDHAIVPPLETTHGKGSRIENPDDVSCSTCIYVPSRLGPLLAGSRICLVPGRVEIALQNPC